MQTYFLADGPIKGHKLSTHLDHCKFGALRTSWKINAIKDYNKVFFKGTTPKIWLKKGVDTSQTNLTFLYLLHFFMNFLNFYKYAIFSKTHYFTHQNLVKLTWIETKNPWKKVSVSHSGMNFFLKYTFLFRNTFWMLLRLFKVQWKCWKNVL